MLTGWACSTTRFGDVAAGLGSALACATELAVWFVEGAFELAGVSLAEAADATVFLIKC